ncbi:glycoside hydrolase family 3 N-terminal domain-containing protein [Ornithinimicrobium sp. LYQ121]|uniref:glycoside hydrolase family 3 protein n=1 Tax=Ornithinimicrobium sp. LYQ121 TaxID=3378801 RepID=UPI003854C73C
MNHRSRRALSLALALPLALSATVAPAAPHGPSGGQDKQNPPAHKDQPALEARVKDTIRIGNKTFKDLNDNGRLDRYEDWRRSTDQRVADLVSRMTLEEKAGLMLIDTLNAGCEGAVPGTADNYQFTQQMRRFIFRNTVVKPGDQKCGTDGGFAAGSTVSAEEAATFMNRMQARSEGTRLGVPLLYKSNARNHIDPDARAGINESAGAFTAFPKEAGIAAAALGAQAAAGEEPTTGDLSVVEDFAEVMGEEWASIGLRGMYGYMADLSTEPRWYRTHETFTEDADLAAGIMTQLVRTLQGPVDRDGSSLSPDTDVALTMKHFPGGGPQELGLDPHYAFGKVQTYPGEAFGYHLKPFEAAIEAGVAAIMPYYGVPVDASYQGEELDQIGFAFSDQVINGLLRDTLGYQGYVNSDTGIINDRAWGLEEATVPERVAAATNSGTDTLSGFNNVSVITGLVEDGLVTEDRVNLAAQRLLAPMFQMGLFENPYVDPAVAATTVGSVEHTEVGLDLQRRSAVLLQNQDDEADDPVLPMKAGSKVYVLGNVDAATVSQAGYEVIDGNVAAGQPRPSAAGADYVVVRLTSRTVSTNTYVSDNTSSGLDTAHLNPSVLEGVLGLDGQSPYGAADACVAYDAANCTDNGLRFGGSFPWESSILDFTGMEAAESWQPTPSLDVIKQVTEEVGDPTKVVLNVYFRQPFVLDEASGLQDAGAILATFGQSDAALVDVLSGDVAPQGRMPFALAGTRQAIEQQNSDTPGYDETTDGALFPFGHGLTYAP